MLETPKLDGLVPARVILVMFKVAVPVFVRVTVCGLLVTCSGWLPKGRLVGDSETKGAAVLVPVPLNGALLGLPIALVVKVRLAEREPIALGVKVTRIRQLEPCSRVAPQALLKIEYSDWLVPVMAILVMLRVAVPVLVRVILLGLLVVAKG